MTAVLTAQAILARGAKPVFLLPVRSPGGALPIRIAIDTLGGDAEPETLVRGALDWALAHGAPQDAAVVLVFFGDAKRIAPLLRGTSHETVDEPRCLAVDDPLRETLRGGLPSSMRSAIMAVADGAADAVVSAGSTGALMALSRHLLGMLPGVRRPAVVKTLAGEQQEFRMLDLGANIGTQPAHLHQFALMGRVAATTVDRVAEPTVALLNIGSEVNKGPVEVRAAARLVDGDERLRYVGFVEPDRLFRAGADSLSRTASQGISRSSRRKERHEWRASCLSGNSPAALFGSRSPRRWSAGD